VLHGSTKRVGGPWSLGGSLLSQSKEVHKNCKKALDCGRKCLDADGFVKSGNHQPNYFHFVNSSMHKLKHPDMHEENEEGEMIGLGKPPGWMFNGCMHFVLCLPRVERDLDNSKVSACFLTGDENLKGAKCSHSRAAAKKRLKLNNDAARTSEIAQVTSLGGGRGMDMKLQLGSAMLCAQLGQLNNQIKRMQAETVGGLLNCAQQEKQGCIELLKTFDKSAEEWDEAREDFKEAKSEFRKFMDQLAGLATLNDGKRTADEEITDDFVNSLRKRPAVVTLHQPTQETVTQEGRLSQIIGTPAQACRILSRLVGLTSVVT
jgi:hypothetical protein